MNRVVYIYYAKANISNLPRIWYVNNYIDNNYNYTDWKSDSANLVLFIEGVSEITASNGFKFTARPGDVIITIPGLSYSWKSQNSTHSHIGMFISDNLKFEILELKDVLAHKYMFDVDKTNILEDNYIIVPFHFTPAPSMEMEKKFNSMYVEFSNQTICTSLVLSELFLNIATTVTRMCIINAGKTNFLPAYNYIYSRKIIEYLNENYKKDLDIGFLADTLKLNRDYMCNIFRKTTNYTLVNYLNKLRINKAKELLLSSSCNINIICKEVGINNEYYFSKLFKKLEGITPKQYRSFFTYPFS